MDVYRLKVYKAINNCPQQTIDRNKVLDSLRILEFLQIAKCYYFYIN